MLRQSAPKVILFVTCAVAGVLCATVALGAPAPIDEVTLESQFDALIQPSDRPPQGAGEVVLAPLAPAIAQALLYATGRRLGVMPFPAEAFQAVSALQ